MKKLIIFSFLLACTSSLFAQDFKPLKDNWGAEVNFAPFSSSPISINYIRLRNFTDDNKAFRLGIFLGANFEKPSEDITNQTIEINFRPGIEQHFEGTRRLSPYIGGELDLAYKYSKSEFDDDFNTATIEGAWTNFGTERGFFRLGANAITGVDFYIVKGLYLGTELGFGFEFIKQSDIVEKANGNEVDNTDGGSSFQLGPNVNGAIRLGFNF
ncbi:MAG: BT1926 family outer membrane beta-barrel protein [Balneola sp.]|jgi:hypothetical protein